MDIVIKELNFNILDDYLVFFDNLEFDEHPGWEKCYCYSYHFTGTSEEWNIEGRNRKKVIELIKNNMMHGYLAYINEKPIGWVNANNKNNYERLKLYEELHDEIEEKICSIVCFVISPNYRNKGIATRLLEQICKDYQDKNYDYIEAYPRKYAASNEDNYKGPKSMYIKKGFIEYKEFQDYEIVRKELKK